MVEPAFTIVQFSDIHSTRVVGELINGFNGFANFERLLTHVETWAVQPDAVIVSGDLSNDGTLESYQRLRATIESSTLANRPWYVGLGNHDDRTRFRAGYLRLPTDASTGQPYDHIADVNGLRIVTLDSTIPGEVGGALRDGQITWLREVLASPAPRGTILMVHHHVVPCPVPRLNEIALANPERLAAVIQGTDVRVILGGHIHFVHLGVLAGIPCFTAPGILAQVIPTIPKPVTSVPGAGYNLIQVRGDQVTVTPGYLPD